jgi:hypothetical protein
MFWIGLIVGVVLANAALIALFVFVVNHDFKSWDEYWNVVEVVTTATDNRECGLYVQHEGEIIDGVILEEL